MLVTELMGLSNRGGKIKYLYFQEALAGCTVVFAVGISRRMIDPAARGKRRHAGDRGAEIAEVG